MVEDVGGRLVRCHDEAEWKKKRSAGITGTGASKACGVNPYESRYSFWCLLTGKLVDTSDPLEPFGPAYWGVQFEQHVIDAFRDERGFPVKQDPEFSLRQDVDHPWMIGTPDGYVYDRLAGGWGVLEVKTAGAYQAHKWEGGNVPHHYLLQLYHYMAITGAPFGYFATLIGGQQYQSIYVPRDEDFIALLRAAEEKFWWHVTTDTPVPVDGHKMTKEAIQERYREYDEERTITLPSDAAGFDANLQDAKFEIAKWMDIKFEAENWLKEAIGEASFGEIPGTGVKYSYRGKKSRRLVRHAE